MVYILENVEKKLTLLSGLKENNSKDITNLDTSNPQYDENKKIYEEMNTRLDTQIDTLLRSVSDVQITREIREQVLNLIKLKNKYSINKLVSDMVYILENVEKKLTSLRGLKENTSKDITSTYYNSNFYT